MLPVTDRILFYFKWMKKPSWLVWNLVTHLNSKKQIIIRLKPGAISTNLQSWMIF